jgi:hypothetical protein
LYSLTTTYFDIDSHSLKWKNLLYSEFTRSRMMSSVGFRVGDCQREQWRLHFGDM